MAKEFPKSFHGWRVVYVKNARGHMELRFSKADLPEVWEESAPDVDPQILFERAAVRVLEIEVAESGIEDRTLWETRLNTAQIDRDVARASRLAGEAARQAAEAKYGKVG